VTSAMDLSAKVRSQAVLHRAWASVRRSGLSSTSPATQQNIKKFEADWFGNIRRIADALREGRFEFTGERGIALPKAKGKNGHRPLVLAPVENRIVRRAILEVLQGYGDEGTRRRRWAGVPAIRHIMSTPTSVGGIPERGVPHGLMLIDQAIRDGHHWFVRSDIQNFFTRIPVRDIVAFVSSATDDASFVALFEKALATNLTNKEELEERHLFKLFPDKQIGVAQGSALSALAGNIALRHFDQAMNGREVVCVRYIDDFTLLATSESKAQAAYRSASALLRSMGMTAYDPDDRQARRLSKVDSGNIYNGTDVLGYRISGLSRQPCAAACRSLLSKLDTVVADGLRAMRTAADGPQALHFDRYHQSQALLDNIVFGWSQSFRHTTAPHVLVSLDSEIDRRIDTLTRAARELAGSACDAQVRRRVAGVHLLADTRLVPLQT